MGALQSSPKGQISLHFNYKVNFKEFYTTLCVSSQVLTNKRYKTYQTGFSFSRLGHVPGVVGLRGTGGQKFHFFQNSTKFGV